MAHHSVRSLTLNSINPHVRIMEYAVRGPILARAEELQTELNSGKSKRFREIIRCNIGDCHATGQLPITFYRQIIAALVYPSLMKMDIFPTDVISRAKRLLESCTGESVGSYSHSLGLLPVRQDVASFIEQRDGIPSDTSDIFLTCGATEAIKYMLQLLSTGLSGNQRAGIMIPIPQYPLYSATNAELDAYQIDYYLDESRNWDFNADELARALENARGKCIPRAIVVINPGNPTGNVLSRDAMQQVIRFAVDNHLVLLADEVYQFNVYDPDQHPWTSFKRVLHEMGPGYSDRLELASFMSSSKGFMGECGFRGGYCELVNFDSDVKSQLYKSLSARLSSPVLGQAMVGCCLNPPSSDEPSYPTYTAEREAVLNALQLKADLVTKLFNSLPGVSCAPVRGAMYAFPKIELPRKAIDAAQALGQKPDFFYCMQFLEEHGVCVVPGSGFGQAEGTFHFRITILPSVEKIKYVVDCFKQFHTDFMKKYAD